MVGASGSAERRGIFRRGSLPGAALMFFVLLDEIEGLAYVALAVLLHQVDLFLQVQSVLFPAALFVSAVSVGAMFWRPKKKRAPEAPPEPVDMGELVRRIGAVPQGAVVEPTPVAVPYDPWMT